MTSGTAGLVSGVGNRVAVSYLLSGYSRDGDLDGWYRDLTVGEAKAGSGTLYAVDRNGKVRRVRVTSVETWKTFPGCVLHLKYGLRKYFQVGGRRLTDGEPISPPGFTRVVVPVRQHFLPETPAGIVSDWVMEKELGL